MNLLQDLDASPLDGVDREAVRAHLENGAGGQLLMTRLSPLDSKTHQSLLVANATLSPSSPSTNALQVCCLARELCREQCHEQGVGRVLMGRLGLKVGTPAYQLLRDGYLNDEMIEELQRQKDVALPGKENAALVNLLWRAFQHPSSSLRSCYAATKGVEVSGGASFPAWYSSESLQVVEMKEQNEEFPCRVQLAFCSQ